MKYIFYIDWYHFSSDKLRTYAISLHPNLKSTKESKYRREQSAGYVGYNGCRINRIKVENETYAMLKNMHCMEFMLYNCRDINSAIQNLQERDSSDSRLAIHNYL